MKFDVNTRTLCGLRYCGDLTTLQVALREVGCWCFVRFELIEH